MKLLFDQNISFRIVKKLPNVFIESKHVSQLGLANENDSEIWNFAKKENFTIVTFDSDFYDLSLIKGNPPKIIWLKTGNLNTIEITDLLIKNSNIISEFLSDEKLKEIACLEIY